MDDLMEELLAEGPGNDAEAYELEKYVRGQINDLDKLRRLCLNDVEDLQSRYRYLGLAMDAYRVKVKRVLPTFGS